jgi:hypothetical protein|tara:strand:- start:1150 stop:1377 length:228 start_codon:yes stop_codon:yes gene_type:complete
MARYMRVEGYESLVRDVRSNAIINDNKSAYGLYMKRVRERERDRDQITAAVKEINNLKKELREIKELLKNGCKKN